MDSLRVCICASCRTSIADVSGPPPSSGPGRTFTFRSAPMPGARRWLHAGAPRRAPRHASRPFAGEWRISPPQRWRIPMRYGPWAREAKQRSRSERGFHVIFAEPPGEHPGDRHEPRGCIPRGLRAGGQFLAEGARHVGSFSTPRNSGDEHHLHSVPLECRRKLSLSSTSRNG